MPQEGTLLPAFVRRDAFDHIMFGYVWGVRTGVIKALPGVTPEGAQKAISVEVALGLFRDEFKLPPEQFNLASQRIRYYRMLREYWQDRKTKKLHAAQEGS